MPRIVARPICVCWCSCACHLGNGREARILGVPTSHRAPDCYVITIRAGLSKGKYRDLLICLAKELRPVSKATCHESSMNQVEFLSVHPRIFRVINDELRVRWNTTGTSQSSVLYHPFYILMSLQIRLAWAQINASHLTLRILIGCMIVC